MRILGIDVGERRIGLATGDTETLIAVPINVLDAMGAPMDWQRIAEEAASRSAEVVVVGMPYSLNGTEGPQATVVGQFVEGLRGVCQVPVVTWDERFTSVEAARLLNESKVWGGDVERKPRRRSGKVGSKARIDASAAAVMLQSYLDARARGQEGQGA